MRRREFIGLMAAVSVAPLVAQAQQDDVPLVGLLGAIVPGGLAEVLLTEGLAEQGWIVGENVRVVRIQTGADPAQIDAGVAELVGLEPDVLVGLALPWARALVRNVSTIPIVFSNVSDAVEAGLVDNITRPGANVTGQVFTHDASWTRQIQLLSEAVPNIDRFGFLFHQDATRPSFVTAFAKDVRSLGFEPELVGVRDVAEYHDAIGAFADGPHSGLVVDRTVVFFANRTAVVDAVASAGIPAIYVWREFADVGGLMAYGPDGPEPIRRAGVYAGRILNGERVADLPVQASTDFNLILNTLTAEGLGITFPSELLAVADEVIE